MQSELDYLYFKQMTQKSRWKDRWQSFSADGLWYSWELEQQMPHDIKWGKYKLCLTCIIASCISANWEVTGWVRENEPEIIVDSRGSESAVCSCEVRQITGWAALGAPHPADSRWRKLLPSTTWNAEDAIPETVTSSGRVRKNWKSPGKSYWDVKVLQPAAGEERGSGAGI